MARNDFLQVDLRVPLNLRLKLDSREVTRFAGRRIASWSKKRMRAGKGVISQEDTTPYKGENRQLIKRVRYISKGRIVAPDWRKPVPGREDDTRLNYYGVMRIHQVAKRWGDVLGHDDPELDQVLQDSTDEAIRRQSAKGKIKLEGELKRIRRGARRRGR